MEVDTEIESGCLAIFRVPASSEFGDWPFSWYPVLVRETVASNRAEVQLLGICPPGRKKKLSQDAKWALAWLDSKGKEVYRQTKKDNDKPWTVTVPRSSLCHCGFTASEGLWGSLPRGLQVQLPARKKLKKT